MSRYRGREGGREGGPEGGRGAGGWKKGERYFIVMEQEDHRSVPIQSTIDDRHNLIVVQVTTYPLQDRYTFLALLQNLMSQYSVMEDELLN